PSTAASYKIGQAQNYTVVAGDTVDSVAQQFNMPVETLIGANHLVYPYALQAGQVLFISGRGGAPGAGGSYTVVPGDTLTRIARRYGTTVPVLAQLNGLTPPYVIKVGQHLTLPGAAPMETAAAAAPGAAGGEMIQFPPASPAPPLPAAPTSRVATENLVPLSSTSTSAAPTVAPSSGSQTATVLPQAQPATPSPGTTSTSSSQESATGGNLAAVPLPSTKPGAGTAPAAPTTTANAATPPSPDTTAAANSASTAAAAPATQPAPTPENVTPPPRHSGKFLWPVNGKVVSLFGVKEGGQHNDGINIAAPLGTPVHAADNGVVAYAGNELRGFGNLLLIRHADGWVSAYAHCDALLVKRGDQVKRGQVIARVGQTGAVSSPQLHFELRKAGTAVDPTSELGPQGA
ncbi:MAG TPA: LysM peptidoglycan-binding domain-containing M23 family metallopeptidase, partial [Dongiaceae bacterium]|nr:LysM peptidoglycan-binding domain-containing M23 family metallopeptidase [Dongiaceae bacterium]